MQVMTYMGCLCLSISGNVDVQHSDKCLHEGNPHSLTESDHVHLQLALLVPFNEAIAHACICAS